MNLILKKFLQGAFMIKGFVRCPLGINLVVVISETTFGNSCGIDHRHHAIDSHLRLDLRPVESRDQRLRQGKAGGFDHDMIGAISAIQKLGHGRDEIIGNSAADAAIVELDHIFLATGLDTAAFQNTAIDPEITELIDDQCNAFSVGVFQQVADHRRFARPKKTRDNSCGNFLSLH